MKIYAVSDLHARPDRIEWISRVKKTEKPDILIIAGDIISYIKPQKTVHELAQLGIPIYYIRGNSDPSRLDGCTEREENFYSLNLKRFDLGEVNLVGVSGTVLLPFRSRVRLFEKKVAADLENLIDEKSILVAHPPPYGTKDKAGGKIHVGSKMLKELVSKTNPSLVICGHIHEDPGEMVLGESLILNCSLGKGGKGTIIEIKDSGQQPIVRFL